MFVRDATGNPIRDFRGYPITPGARVYFQVSPRLRWRAGIVTPKGTIEDDYDGIEHTPWHGNVALRDNPVF